MIDKAKDFRIYIYTDILFLDEPKSIVAPKWGIFMILCDFTSNLWIREGFNTILLH